LPEELFPWKRYWSPAETQIHLDDGGYLPDPDSTLGHVRNPQVIPFVVISSIPCLALLGEPGMGKTSALAHERQEIDFNIREAGGETLRLNLRSYSSEVRLVGHLFEGKEFKEWLAGNHLLHIFLDSLDECLLKISTVATLLIDELARYKNSVRERLYFRIACRTAEWPTSLAEGLQDLWGKEQFRSYVLAPLCRQNVVDAARVRRIDTDGFLRIIDEREAVPLAIKPITLKFLLNAYHRQGAFPATQKALYREGCRVLCEEPNSDKREAHLIGPLTSDQRIRVAERIAAVTVFGNFDAIWLGIDLGAVDMADVTVAQLAQGGKPILESAIRATLDSALFSWRGPERIGWAHQTYAEFLAACFVAQSEMQLPQVLSLIVHPGDSERKLVPQLHEVAAWLAGMYPGVREHILQTDPDVLMRSDVATTDPAHRAALVQTLLASIGASTLQLDYRTFHLYRKLSHPELATQLRSYIGNSSLSETIRYHAMRIAEACELRELLDDLIGIARDTSESSVIRQQATIFVSRLGDATTRARLRPLLSQLDDHDPKDNIRGYVLRALWPDEMSTDELFEQLSIPKRDYYTGYYDIFLRYELPNQLRPRDLSAALQWVIAQPVDHPLPDSFRQLAEAIMRAAWANLSSPDIMEPFAAALLLLSRHPDSLSFDLSDPAEERPILDDTRIRHSLIEAMLQHCSDSANDTFIFLHARPPVVRQDDISWLHHKVLSAVGAQAAIIAKLSISSEMRGRQLGKGPGSAEVGLVVARGDEAGEGWQTIGA